MTLELDGIRFNVSFGRLDDRYIMSLTTETPCCTDVGYFGIIKEPDIPIIKKAIKNKQISLEFQRGYRGTIEFSYWNHQNIKHTIVLHEDESAVNDGLPEDIKEKVHKLKEYFELVRELEACKAELATYKKEI